MYTANNDIDFPGRKFAVKDLFHFHKTAMKKHLEGKRCNITARNFPVTVEDLRKKWKLKDGGDLYCFFTTNLNNEKIVLLCEKLQPMKKILMALAFFLSLYTNAQQIKCEYDLEEKTDSTYLKKTQDYLVHQKDLGSNKDFIQFSLINSDGTLYLNFPTTAKK